ncbi:MAG: hypothetical protein ABIJ18_01620 [archaeon]
MGFLNPTWLIQQIDVIALILAAAILVIFSSFVNKYFVFPVADVVREKAHKNVNKVKYVNKISKYLSDALATVIFLAYCFIGTTILATYVIAPILRQSSGILLIMLFVAFMLVSYTVNNKQFRKRFF